MIESGVHTDMAMPLVSSLLPQPSLLSYRLHGSLVCHELLEKLYNLRSLPFSPFENKPVQKLSDLPQPLPRQVLTIIKQVKTLLKQRRSIIHMFTTDLHLT